MTTKDRILEAATTLFNDATTGEVSTNHIARAAGISPGNLYYHYPNKEAIIRAILERMFGAFGEVWVLPRDRAVTLDDVPRTVHTIFGVLWRFRFFYREALALTRRDPALGERHRQMQVQRIGEQEKFFRRFAEDGVLKPGDSEQLRAVITACWIIANNWLSFVETSGETVDSAQLGRGVDLILRVLEPYLADDAVALHNAALHKAALHKKEGLDAPASEATSTASQP